MVTSIRSISSNADLSQNQFSAEEIENGIMRIAYKMDGLKLYISVPHEGYSIDFISDFLFQKKNAHFPEVWNVETKAIISSAIVNYLAIKMLLNGSAKLTANEPSAEARYNFTKQLISDCAISTYPVKKNP